MPLLSAGVLLWSRRRRRRVGAAALCAGLLSPRRHRSAQLVHRTVPRVAITVRKHDQHEHDERGEDDGNFGDDPNVCDVSGASLCRLPQDSVGVDGSAATFGASRAVPISGDVSVLLGGAAGPASAGARPGEAAGKTWISSVDRETWPVDEGRPWILDGDGPWNVDGEGPWTGDGEGLWTDVDCAADVQLPDCLCSAECRSVWALTLDNAGDRSRDEESADSGAHVSPGLASSSSSGVDQSRERQLRESPHRRLANSSDAARESAAQSGQPDDPLAADLTARQLWRSGGSVGAALQVCPTTCDLLARIATVWQADLEERRHLDRHAADSGQSESDRSSPPPASTDGEVCPGRMHVMRQNMAAALSVYGQEVVPPMR